MRFCRPAEISVDNCRRREQGMIEMKRIPPEIHVVEVESLPAHHLEALKELVRRAALRKLRQMQEAQKEAA